MFVIMGSFYSIFHFLDFTIYGAKHGESIVIGLAASSTSNGPQVKITGLNYSHKL